jgi:hypothetical protein
LISPRSGTEETDRTVPFAVPFASFKKPDKSPSVPGFPDNVTRRLLNNDHEAISDRSKTVRIVLDSRQVRGLISDAERLNREKRAEGGRSEQITFVDAMRNQPSIEIPPGSYCHILEQSEATCSKNPLQNPKYIKVRVTTGSAKGQIGWGCQGVDITREDAMP